MTQSVLDTAPDLSGASLQAYAGAIRNWRADRSATMPALDASAVSAQTFMEDALFQDMLKTRQAPDTPVAIGLREDPFCVLALGHAVLAEKRVTLVVDADELETVLPRLAFSRSATLILSPQGCIRLGADRIAALFERAGIANWGILSGLGLAEASRLIARLAARTPSITLSGTLYCGFQSANRSPRLAGLLLRDVAETPMPLKVDAPAPGFSYFRGHGRSHCGLDGNICTNPTASVAGDPRCVGGYECMFPDFERLPARGMALDFCVLDVCAPASFRPRGPQQAEGFNLALHLQAGSATSILAPSRYHSSAGFSPFLAWHLARTGATVGRIRQALNTYFQDRFDQHPPYVLLGDPEMQIFAATPSATASARITRERLQIDPIPGQTLFYPFAADMPKSLNLYTDKEGAFLRSPADIVEIAGETGLLVGWDSDVDTGPCQLRPRDCGPAAALNGAALRDWAFNARHLPLAEADRPASLTKALSTATQFESFLANSGGATVMDGGLRKLEADILGNLTDLFELAGLDVLHGFRHRAATNDAWLPVGLAHGVGMTWVSSRLRDDTCPHCTGQLLTRTYRAGYFDPHFREVKECEHHLLVSDRPQDLLVDLRLDVADRATLGYPFGLRVSGRNGGDRPAQIVIGLSIVRQKVDPADICITPEARSILVAPGAALEAEFEMTLGQSAWAMGHNVQAILLCNGAAVSLYRQVQFTRGLP